MRYTGRIYLKKSIYTAEIAWLFLLATIKRRRQGTPQRQPAVRSYRNFAPDSCGAIIRECIEPGEHAPLWSAQLVSIQRRAEEA